MSFTVSVTPRGINWINRLQISGTVSQTQTRPPSFWPTVDLPKYCEWHFSSPLANAHEGSHHYYRLSRVHYRYFGTSKKSNINWWDEKCGIKLRRNWIDLGSFFVWSKASRPDTSFIRKDLKVDEIEQNPERKWMETMETMDPWKLNLWDGSRRRNSDWCMYMFVRSRAQYYVGQKELGQKVFLVGIITV